MPKPEPTQNLNKPNAILDPPVRDRQHRQLFEEWTGSEEWVQPRSPESKIRPHLPLESGLKQARRLCTSL